MSRVLKTSFFILSSERSKVVRTSNLSFKHDIRRAGTGISKFYLENSHCEEFGEGRTSGMT